MAEVGLVVMKSPAPFKTRLFGNFVEGRAAAQNTVPQALFMWLTPRKRGPYSGKGPFSYFLCFLSFFCTETKGSWSAFQAGRTTAPSEWGDSPSPIVRALGRSVLRQL